MPSVGVKAGWRKSGNCGGACRKFFLVEWTARAVMAEHVIFETAGNPMSTVPLDGVADRFIALLGLPALLRSA